MNEFLVLNLDRAILRHPSFSPWKLHAETVYLLTVLAYNAVVFLINPCCFSTFLFICAYPASYIFADYYCMLPATRLDTFLLHSSSIMEIVNPFCSWH